MTGIHWYDAIVGLVMVVGIGLGLGVSVALDDRDNARRELGRDPWLPHLWECSCGVIGRAATRQQAHDDYQAHGRTTHPYPAVTR